MTVPPRTYAPVPHELILGQPAPLIRLWGLLHWLEWQHEAYEIEDLAARLDTTIRTVYRWLDQLAAAGWITYNRETGSRAVRLNKRVVVCHEPVEFATSGSQRPEVCDPTITKSTSLRHQDHKVHEFVIVGSQSPEVCDPTITNFFEIARPDAENSNPHKTPDQIPDSDPQGGGDPRTHDPVPVGSGPAARAIKPRGYTDSRDFLIEQGAMSEARIAAAAALPLWMLQGIHAESLAALGDRSGRAIGRTLTTAATAAADPAKAAALANALARAAQPPLPDPERTPDVPPRPARSGRSVGSGRRRAAVEAAQPRPDLSDGSGLSDADLDAIIAEESARAEQRRAS